jgi:hypothetical protein
VTTSRPTRNRSQALHGLACERCRHEDFCVTDVVTDLIEIMTSDPNAEVRHKTVAALARFIGRDGRAGQAIACAAHHDPDPAIREVAQAVRIAVSLTFAGESCIAQGTSSKGASKDVGAPAAGSAGASVEAQMAPMGRVDVGTDWGTDVPFS